MVFINCVLLVDFKSDKWFHSVFIHDFFLSFDLARSKISTMLIFALKKRALAWHHGHSFNTVVYLAVVAHSLTDCLIMEREDFSGNRAA